MIAQLQFTLNQIFIGLIGGYIEEKSFALAVTFFIVTSAINVIIYIAQVRKNEKESDTFSRD